MANGAGPFYFPDGRARFLATEYRPPTEDVDDEFPVMLTTGRVVSQFLSGTQTRRIGPLVDHYPEPRVEIHPNLAAQYAIADGDWVDVESRRVDVRELEIGDYLCHPGTGDWAILDEEPSPGEDPDTTVLILRDAFSGEREETEVASDATIEVKDLAETHLAAV